MKYQFILACTLLLALSLAFASNLKRNPKHIVIDKSSTGTELTHVVRRNPTITSTHKYGLPNGAAPSSTMSFGANNDDNGPNLGGWGKTAAIASKITFFNLRPLYLLPRSGWYLCYPRNPCSCRI